MMIPLEPELESALNDFARKRGVAPEILAHDALRERFLICIPQAQLQDEWERRLLRAASDCGVALAHEAVSSEGLYE